MPTPVIHLSVAEKLAEISKINDVPNFYLGSVAPDAFYLKPTYYDIEGKHERHLTAHLNDPDFSIWKNKIKDFISENNTQINRDFYLGYAVHILTDIYWKETVYAEFTDKCPDKSWEGMRAVYYREIEQIEYEIYKTFELGCGLRDHLLNSAEIGINGLVTADEVKSWKENILLLFYDFDNKERNDPAKYITYNQVYEFVLNASAVISDIINKKP